MKNSIKACYNFLLLEIFCLFNCTLNGRSTSTSSRAVWILNIDFILVHVVYIRVVKIFIIWSLRFQKKCTAYIGIFNYG